MVRHIFGRTNNMKSFADKTLQNFYRGNHKRDLLNSAKPTITAP